MAMTFDDFDIVVERGPVTAARQMWGWCVRRRTDGALFTSGHAFDSRAAACGDAAKTVFQLLASQNSIEQRGPAGI